MTDDARSGPPRDEPPAPAPIVAPHGVAAPADGSRAPASVAVSGEGRGGYGGPPGHTPEGYGTPQGYPPPEGYGTPQGYPPPQGYALPDPGQTARSPYPGQAGWAPPPRPGLIPLAPLTFGTILGAPYRLFRFNPRPTFGMSLLIQGGILLITLAVVGLVGWATFSRVEFAASSEEEELLLAGALGTTLLSSLIPIALSILATGVMQGIIVLEVSRQTLGQKQTFAALWARGKGRVWAVAGYSVVLAVALALAIGVVVAIGFIPFVFGEAGAAAGVVLTIVLLLGLLVGVVALNTKLAFVPSAIVLERLDIRAAIVRSWTLTRQVFWRTLGILALVAVILGVASQVVSFPISFVAGIAVGVFAPTGDPEAIIATFVIVYSLFAIASLVIAAISLVVQSATSALLYIDRRVRLEGLDLDLMRFVEARQSGATDLRDPYETAPRPTA